MDSLTFTDLTKNNGLFIDGDWIESKDQDPNGDVRLIQLADIGDGYFVNKSKRYLTSDKAKELKCTFLNEGDVLVARMPDPLGRACTFPGLEMPCITVVDVCIIRPNSAIASSAWLKYLINSSGFRRKIGKYITGTTRQRISRGNLAKIEFRVPTPEDQKRIVEKLNVADSLRQKRKTSIQLIDEYSKSIFVEMFGDPVQNPKKWDKKPLSSFGQIITGNTPSRSNDENYSIKHIEWVKTDNIHEDKLYVTSANEFLSEKGLSGARYVTPGAVLIACIAGSAKSIGKVAMADRKVSFNQQINAIQPNDDVNPLFLYWLIKISKDYILSHATSGMKKILTKGAMQKIIMILPPIDIQNEFAERAKLTQDLKLLMLSQSLELDEQYQALVQKAFTD